MNNVLDWMLEKMQLTYEDDEEQIKQEQKIKQEEKSRSKPSARKMLREPENDARIFFKKITAYGECKQVIDNYKPGCTCVFCFTADIPEAQSMMSYICGGIYALQGEIKDVGDGVFIII